MPYKYIGRTTDLKGKSLWEIVGNLKNFGLGRIVARNKWECYPEPSFMKIVKVEALPAPETFSYDNSRKVRVWVERTFRGKLHPQLVLIESVSYKPDYKLIAKDEEKNYCKKVEEHTQERILPTTTDFPPLMKELILREAKAKGQDISEEPRLELVYNKMSMLNKYRIAKEGEKPNVNLTIKLGTPASPNLYEGIVLE